VPYFCWSYSKWNFDKVYPSSLAMLRFVHQVKELAWFFLQKILLKSLTGWNSANILIAITIKEKLSISCITKCCCMCLISLHRIYFTWFPWLPFICILPHWCHKVEPVSSHTLIQWCALFSVLEMVSSILLQHIWVQTQNMGFSQNPRNSLLHIHTTKLTHTHTQNDMKSIILIPCLYKTIFTANTTLSCCSSNENNTKTCIPTNQDVINYLCLLLKSLQSEHDFLSKH